MITFFNRWSDALSSGLLAGSWPPMSLPYEFTVSLSNGSCVSSIARKSGGWARPLNGVGSAAAQEDSPPRWYDKMEGRAPARSRMLEKTFTATRRALTFISLTALAISTTRLTNQSIPVATAIRGSGYFGILPATLRTPSKDNRAAVRIPCLRTPLPR